MFGDEVFMWFMIFRHEVHLRTVPEHSMLGA